MANRSISPVLRLEELEGREVPAVLIQVDYTYDTGFFAHNPEARATVERVAAELGNSLSANLAAIVPGGGNTWAATFQNPTTGSLQTLTDLTVGANTVRLFVGARLLGGGEAGYATTTGFSAAGSPGWLDTVETRGHSGFAPWGGSIAFDSAVNWHFGATTAGLDANELDFYSVAAHELGHVLGLGTSPQWNSLASGGTFRGASAMGVYGGPVPLDPDAIHWADGLTLNGQPASLDPSLAYGQRVGLTALDITALRDLGWVDGGGALPLPPGMTLFAVAGRNGVIGQYAYYQGMTFPTGQQFAPFPGLTGALPQTFGDFDGDGVFDVAVGTPGMIGAMAVVSGLDGRVIGAPQLAHGSVTALFAADLDGNGRPELIAREGTGVYVYRVVGGAVRPYGGVSVYGEPGRAALRVAGTDVDRAGYGDALAPAVPSAPAAGDRAAEHPTAQPEGANDRVTVAAAPVGQAFPVLDGPAPAQEAAPHDEPAGSGFAWEDELLSGVWVG